MSDFFQNGEVATLHDLGEPNLEELESKISRFARHRPIALVLPTLYSELKGEALPKIIGELKNVTYLEQVVVTLGKAGREEFGSARDYFSTLPGDVKLVWNDGDRIQELYRMLEREGVSAGEDGKGRSAWMAYGYVLACERSDVIVLHDCDIVTYTRDILARLSYPVVNPHFDLEFCKGYYSRVTDRMHGRVMRLFVVPLIRSLIKINGPTDFLTYLDSFRYHLSGEFAMVTDLARRNRIPGDWGLEVGVLSEVYRNCSKKRIGQVDICRTYEHKHQELSAENPEAGLMKMSIEIAQTIFRTMSSMGEIFTESFFSTLRATYLRNAQDFIARYAMDADINGLYFDRDAEARAVESFVGAIGIAGGRYLEDPMGTPAIPNWNRVSSAIPDFFEMLLDAVEKDNS